MMFSYYLCYSSAQAAGKEMLFGCDNCTCGTGRLDNSIYINRFYCVHIYNPDINAIPAANTCSFNRLLHKKAVCNNCYVYTFAYYICLPNLKICPWLIYNRCLWSACPDIYRANMPCCKPYEGLCGGLVSGY